MPTSVTVMVPARLHLGFLDLNGEIGRRFGSIGLAIDGLGTRITIKTASRSAVKGPDRERAMRHLQVMQDSLGVSGAHELTVQEVVPAHAGLGSGTQMALAVAAAIRRLHHRELDARAD